MKIVIAEKPSVGKAIAKFFGATKPGAGCVTGDGVVVTWCFGHLFEQANPEEYDAKYKSWNMSLLPIVPEIWKLLPKDDAKTQIKIIGDLLKNATEVVHAGDPDREGQLLVDEVLEHFNYKGPVKRLWLAAMDDASIKKAIGSMKNGNEYRPMKLAAEARARADWLVGMNLTRGWTNKGRQAGHDGVLSVGRVQTPTLGIIVKRDFEVENFKSKEFFEVEGAFPFPAIWKPSEAVTQDEEGRLLDKSTAVAVAMRVMGNPAKVTKYESKRCSQAAPLPFSLSSLQQAASAKYGLSAQQTLDIAQALYETHKMTSYPRTDCRHLPESMHCEAVHVLNSLSGEYQMIAAKADASRKSGAFNDKKITAHHAIIPTTKADIVLAGNELKVYDLIVRAYLSQFYPEFQFQQVNVAVECVGEVFATSGRTTLEDGWKTVYGVVDDEDEEAPQPKLPPLTVGDELTCTDAKVLAKKTTPPKRFTDGTLIAAMTNVYKLVDDPEIKKRLKETAGIGTEATRAGIIETLIKRKFIEKKGKQLISTSTGRILSAALGDSEIVNVGTTGVFEGFLDEIAQGKLDPSTFLQKVSESVSGQVEALRTGANINMPATPGGQKKGGGAEIDAKCPKCQKGVVADDRTVSCQCGFKLWRQVAGLNLSIDQCKKLIKVGLLPTTAGFTSKAEKPFAAGLRLAGDLSGKVEFVFEQRK
jgi:DNA topoisomerase-3